jgi:formamidase
LTGHGKVLATWNKREGELIAANKLDRIVAQPPNETNVHAGSASEEIKEKVGREGARTIPGRSSLEFLSGLVFIID